jgi:hypothetical protein
VSTFVEAIAQDLLASDGIAAIWKIHMVAAQAHRIGRSHAAEILLDLADAAEELYQQGLEEIRQERRDRQKAT